MQRKKDMLVIFDLDGTIFRTKETIFPAVEELLIEIGHDDDVEELIKSLIGEKTSVFCERIKPDNISMDEFMDKLWIKEKEYIDKNGELYKGIKEVLEELENSEYEMILCSNGNRDYIEYVLDRFDIKGYFSQILSGSEYNDKSDAVGYILKDYEAEKGILIGDRDLDRKAAEDNDLIFIGALYGYGKNEIEDEYFAVEEPKEILGYVNRLNIFSEIEDDFKELREEKIKVIGVNGIDNSGKTTFTNQLSHYLKSRGYGTEVVSIDDFHNPKEVRRNGENPLEAYYNNAFDYEKMIDKILEPISKNDEVHKLLKLLNINTDIYDIEKQVDINKNDVVIIEGVLLFRPPLERYIDYKIYLDIDYDEGIKRAKKRDKNRFENEVVKRYKKKYIPIQKRYIEENNPKIKSDITIDNNDFERPKISQR